MVAKDPVSGCVGSQKYHACSLKCHCCYNDFPPQLTIPFRSHLLRPIQLEKLNGSWEIKYRIKSMVQVFH